MTTLHPLQKMSYGSVDFFDSSMTRSLYFSISLLLGRPIPRAPENVSRWPNASGAGAGR